MRSRHIAMSWEAFELLPASPGWKHEYWEGAAHITPRSRFALMRLALERRDPGAALPLRALADADEAGLVSAYFDAFADTVEYCDWEADAIRRSARENIEAFCGGGRGDRLAASCLAIDPAVEDPAEGVAGAALLTRPGDGSPLLDMLLVRPRWQRRGLATALLSWSLGELHLQGDTILRSRYHLANEASRAWHRKLGFAQEPDLSSE